MSAGLTYGQRFADFYDRIFPRATAETDAAVARLAALHRPELGPPLEMAVGTGRIAVPLSERVGEVVGVDISPEMLDGLATFGADVTPVLGDMCTYDASHGHGLVYCVLCSLTLLPSADDQAAAVRRLAEAAAPEAAVVIESPNPDSIRALHGDRVTETRIIPYEEPDTALLTQMTLHPGGTWQLVHLFVDDGRVRVADETCLPVEPGALDAMAGAAGLVLEGRYGDWEGAPPSAALPMLVSEYRRPA